MNTYQIEVVYDTAATLDAKGGFSYAPKRLLIELDGYKTPSLRRVRKEVRDMGVTGRLYDFGYRVYD